MPKNQKKTSGRKKKELSALFAISQIITSTMDFETVLQTVVDNASGLAKIDSGAIYLVRDDKLYLGATTPQLPKKFPEEFREAVLSHHPHIEKALSAKYPHFIADINKADLSAAERSICEARNLRSLLYLPLIIENRSIGILILGTTGKPRTYSESEITLYFTVSTEMALAVENAILFQENQGYVADLEKRIAQATADLTESNSSLQTLNRKYKLHIESTPLGIIEWDSDFRVTEWNPAAEQIFGFTAEEAMGKYAHEIIVSEEVRRHVNMVWSDLLRNRGGARSTNENIRKDGNRIICEWYNTPLVDDEGKVFGVASAVQDITEQKKAFSTLNTTQDISLSIMEDLQDEIVERKRLSRKLEIQNREQKTLTSILTLSLENMAFKDLLDKCLKEVLSVSLNGTRFKGSIFIVDRNSRSLTMAASIGIDDSHLEECKKGIPLGHCLCGRVAENGELIFTTGIDDRHEIIYEGMAPHGHYCVPIKTSTEVLGVMSIYLDEGTLKDDEDAAFLTTVAATIAGIIDRKRIENKLLESEKKHREIISTTREGFWLLNADKRIIDINESLSLMLGYGREEIIGKCPIDLASKESAEIFKAQSSKITASIHRVYEIVLISKSGEEIPAIVHATTIKDKDGNMTGSFAFVTDVSELKRVESELRKARDEAEEATKLKDKFVSLVSHDLKNPINLISNYLELLNMTEQISDNGKEMIDEGAQACIQMTALINEVLKLSRIRGGKIMPHYSFVYVRHVAEQSIKNYNRIAEDKGIYLTNETPEKTRIYADEKLLVEVLRNLISNAIKFCSKGDRVKLYCPDAERGAIAVADTGIGIKNTRIATLFSYEEKTSTRGTAGEAGTGFGLPLCNDIVTAHGGKMTVESETGKGSTFYVRLPEIKPKILYVDDEDSIRKLAGRFLEKEDLEFLSAGNGEEALELIEARNPHMLFIDLHMPGISGLELIEKVKQSPDTESIPVIIVTADETMEAVDHAFQQGADDFIVKPFKKEELIKCVEKYLE